MKFTNSGDLHDLGRPGRRRGPAPALLVARPQQVPAAPVGAVVAADAGAAPSRLRNGG